MDLMGSLVRNTFLPLDLWRVGEHGGLRYLKEYEQSQYFSLERLRELQLGRLRALLAHAQKNCPFYAERFRRAGMAIGDIKSLEDLRNLPVLEKGDIQNHRDEMVATNWLKKDLLPNITGGSTGAPLSFYLSRDRKMSRFGATWRHNGWAGCRVGDKVAWIWGASRDQPSRSWKSRLRNFLIDRQMFLDTGHVTNEALENFHFALRRFRPKSIIAYARAAVLFARYLISRNLEPYRPASIITSAEVLEPEERALLERVFGCRVFNRYGCREVSVIASECEAHSGLHTMAEGLFIEVLPLHAEIFPGNSDLGGILVTDLLNWAMPLIRYRIGDLGAWQKGDCTCGRTHPRLREVAGRVTDFIVGLDGRAVSGAFLSLYVIGKRPSLGQVQILQNEIGRVRYRIKPGKGFEERSDLEYLRATTKEYVGPGSNVECELVTELTPEPSGKTLLSRSTVTPTFLTKHQ
jgi:phenylacetate-CoA ligase